MQDFLRYNRRLKDGSYVEGIIMSIVTLDSCVATVIRYILDKKKRGGDRQKVHADTYGSMVETARKPLI